MQLRPDAPALVSVSSLHQRRLEGLKRNPVAPSYAEGRQDGIGVAGLFQMPDRRPSFTAQPAKRGLGGHFSRWPAWRRKALDRAGTPWLFLATARSHPLPWAMRRAPSNQLKTL
jgi:hypothetical protein